jgi:late competence protein required for DNA uptake (superfamily II DNA/RNA helicase)
MPLCTRCKTWAEENEVTYPVPCTLIRYCRNCYSNLYKNVHLIARIRTFFKNIFKRSTD